MHVVNGLHFLLQHDGSEERVDAKKALLIGMLSYEKENGALLEALSVLVYHVISHDLYVAPVALQ